MATNAPALSATVLWSEPSSTRLSATAAPGIAAPPASRTTPVMVPPNVDCANAPCWTGNPATRARNAKAASFLIEHDRKSFFIVLFSASSK